MARLKQLRFVERRYHTQQCALFCFICIACTPCAYSDGWSFQYHGFVSQAYVKTDRNNFFGNSNRYGSFDFREIGLNASAKPLPDLLTAAQLLYRSAGESDPGELRFDYAIADYRAANREKMDIGLRFGRIKNPIGLYNETRDVAFTRASVILPQSIYFDRVRDLGLSSDGAQLYGDVRSESYELSVQLQVAKPRVGTSMEMALFQRDMPGEFNSKYSYLGRITLDIFSGKLKLAYSNVGLHTAYAPNSIEPVPVSSVRFYPQIVSMQLNISRLSMTAEYARRRFEFSGLSAYGFPGEQTGESYYLQSSFHLTNSVNILARYDLTYLDVNDRDGRKTETRSAGIRAAHSQYATDMTLGLQWDAYDRWLVMIEQHWIDGTAWLPVQDNPTTTSVSSRWWMLNALVSYRF